MIRTQKLPKYLQPMLATLIDAPFDDPEWVFETKWDGFRMVAEIKKGKVTLYSRNGEVVNTHYPSIEKALQKIRHNCVIDGELVALDVRGRSRFQLLQNVLRTKTPLRYCIFDIMFRDGVDLRKLPLLRRKDILKKLLPKQKMLFYSAHRSPHGKKYFIEARSSSEEGIMAKRAASAYHSGIRSREWLKIKVVARQEAVIVGFTKPQHSRKYFGSLVLAVYDKKKLRYVGHVGTGFTAASLKDMYHLLVPLKRATKPLSEKIKYERTTTWIQPKLVGDIQFTEWTSGGEMRHPSFIALRSDKRPQEVIREKSKRR